MPHRTSAFRMHQAVAVALGAASVLFAAEGRADEKQACLDSYDKAQTMRQEGKLMEAHDALIVCVRPACPSIIKKDCTQWLSEVDQATPSVVIEARGPDGQDAVDVTVSVDGKPFVSQIDGKAVAINPGVHTFRFELEGAEAIEQRIVIHEAVKNRRISVEFKKPGVASGGGASPQPTDGSSKPGADEGTEPKAPYAAYALGGLGLVGIGGFTYFGLKFDSELNDMDKCAPNCAQSVADHASQTRLFALISGGVGVVSLGVATYLFLAPSGTPSASVETGRIQQVDLVPVQGGALGSIRGVF